MVCSSLSADPLLERCLSGYRAVVERLEDLVFVDNGSPDNTCRWAAHRFAGITAVRLPVNRWFCGGYNAGIRIALERGYDFVLISNADTEVVNPAFVRDLLDAAGRWPRAAFVGPRVFYRSTEKTQKTCLRFPSVLRCAGVWLPRRLARPWFEGQPDRETAVEFLNGVCVLCRLSALREIGLMDEIFGAYVEDADWSWRAREKGWASVFTPVPSVVHHEAAFGYEHYALKSFLLKRNSVYWFLKVRKRMAAWTYAQASLLLAGARLRLSPSQDRMKHQYFVRKLKRVFGGLLAGEPPGEWFGPPLGAWEGG